MILNIHYHYYSLKLLFHSSSFLLRSVNGLR
jgi:hypothetical protein